MKHDVNDPVISDIKVYVLNLAAEDYDYYSGRIFSGVLLLEHLTGKEWYLYKNHYTEEWILDFEEE